MKTTQIDIQMRFADIDALGHVNNVNLQHYFDLGKSDYYGKVLGLDQMGGELFIIAAATSTSYLAQTRHWERIYVETSVEKIGNKSMTLFQRIIARETEEVKAESRSVMVAFDFKAQTSVPIPDIWRSEIGEVGE